MVYKYLTGSVSPCLNLKYASKLDTFYDYPFFFQTLCSALRRFPHFLLLLAYLLPVFFASLAALPIYLSLRSLCYYGFGLSGFLSLSRFLSFLGLQSPFFSRIVLAIAVLPSVSSTSRCQWFQGYFICLYAYSIYKHFIKSFLGTIHVTFLHPATSLYISMTSNTTPLRSKLYRLWTHCSGSVDSRGHRYRGHVNRYADGCQAQMALIESWRGCHCQQKWNSMRKKLY
jgi:hypothetical protein